MSSPVSPTCSPASDLPSGDLRWRRWPGDCIHLEQARQIWDKAPIRNRLVVAVIDDGFDLDHPALRDNLWRMPGQPDVHGWDFIDGDADPSPAAETPVSSHGTMVAGIIGGRPDITGSFAGVAPNVELMLLRWRANNPPEAHADPANMAAALRFAVTRGARIVNISAGIDTSHKPADALADLENAFNLAENQGVLVVVAAPNLPDNLDTATDWLPGAYPFTNIVHVTGHCRELRLLGAWGKKSVDIAAPAEDITGPSAGGGYRSGCATSLAAPLVTGALALVWGLLPNLQAEQVRRLILRNAKRLAPEAQPHEVWGHTFPATPQGRLDLTFLERAWKRYWSGRDLPGCFPAQNTGHDRSKV